MKRRQQAGSVWERCGKWYVRYAEYRNVDGKIKRVRVTHCLGDKDTKGRSVPEKITEAAQQYLDAVVNKCAVKAERVVTIRDFMETVFLPECERRLKPSTTKNYRLDWNLRVKVLTAGDGKSFKDYETHDVQNWLNQIADEGKLAKNSVKGTKAFLSSVFNAAKRLGYYSKANPVDGTLIDHRLREAEDTYAYSLEENFDILNRLPEPAATMFAIAAYAGLRRGEIEGLKWENYRDGELHVEFSVWAGEVGKPKSRSSRAAVPVIRQLAEILKAHHERCGKPESGWMFKTSNDTPLSLHNVVNRQILPTLESCVHCGLLEGLQHRESKDCPGYERDENKPEWHGFHAARRGVGSNLNRLGVDDTFISKVLRHSNVSTTQKYYIKATDEDTLEAMSKYEAEIERMQAEIERLKSLRATVMPATTFEVEKPKFVN